jgi:hypothetical protein
MSIKENDSVRLLTTAASIGIRNIAPPLPTFALSGSTEINDSGRV